MSNSSETPREYTVLCLSGGPRAGKSTALNRLSSLLRSYGYAALLAPEGATFLMSTGVSFADLSSDDDVFDFQAAVMKQMMLIEEFLAVQATRLLRVKRERGAADPLRGVVIITDRGLLDCKAYCSAAVWARLLQHFELDEMRIRDRYDAVFFLRSSADLPELYEAGRGANPARFESAGAARDTDQRLIEAYHVMDRMQVFGNETDFDRKMDRLVRAIHALLGLSFAGRLQLHYRLAAAPVYPPDVAVVSFDVTESCLTAAAVDGTVEAVLVRRRQPPNNYESYSLRRRVLVQPGGDTAVLERSCNPRLYNLLLAHLDPARPQLHLRRSCFSVGDQFFAVDLLPDAHVTLTCTADAPDAVHFPDFIACTAPTLLNTSDHPFLF